MKEMDNDAGIKFYNYIRTKRNITTQIFVISDSLKGFNKIQKIHDTNLKILKKPYFTSDILREIKTFSEDNSSFTKNKVKSLFISYTWSDKDFVKRIIYDLKKSGIKCWIDENEIKIGDSLIEKIREGIDSVDYLAVVLSPASIESEWVKHEVDIAMNQAIEGRRVKVLPILYKKCKIPWFLEGKVYADFTDKSLYESSLKKVLDSVNQ